MSPVFSAARMRPTLLLAGLSLLLATGCKKDDDKQPSTAYGPEVAIGTGGSARTYINSDASGNPTEVGIRLSEGALNTLPATPAMGTMYDLDLPASKDKTPFDHVSFDWNPNGHEPAGVYTVPHFDAHFYMQSHAEQHTITLDDPKGDLFPPTDHLPTGYSTPPNVVPGRTIPMMGRHWVDPTSPEYTPAGFSSTFIYGTYDSKVTFLEPMFTKAMLTTAVNFSSAIKQPAVYEATGKYYPTTYAIRYDAAAKEYVIALTGLTKR